MALMPSEILITVLYPVVNAIGWEKSPWSDDTCANKRIFPGGVPRTESDLAWITRLTVTTKSMVVLFRCQMNKHQKLMRNGSHHKIPKAKMDWDGFAQPWVVNDPHLHLEGASAMITKPHDFAPQVLTKLNMLMESYRGPRNYPIMEAMMKLEDHKASLDAREFQHFMHQVTYDLDAWMAHLKTCSDYIAAMAKQKHSWNLKRHKQCGMAADALIKQNCLVIVYGKDPYQPVLEFLAFEKESGIEPSDIRRLCSHLCLVQPCFPEHFERP